MPQVLKSAPDELKAARNVCLIAGYLKLIMSVKRSNFTLLRLIYKTGAFPSLQRTSFHVSVILNTQRTHFRRHNCEFKSETVQTCILKDKFTISINRCSGPS